ncbi:MAG: hypothetical protein LBF12_00305 [Christensenellaceae bacterium]|jgi:hypothetical protein|nr:hypothetical protein [Christensenellaceae bacterium]
MKYINREYGFEGRPPFSKDFFETRESFNLDGTILFTKKPAINLTLNGLAPVGIYATSPGGSIWNLKVSISRNKRQCSDEEFWKICQDFIESDSDFLRILKKEFTIKATKLNANSAVIKIVAHKKLNIQLQFSSLLPNSNIKIDSNIASVFAPFRGVTLGDFKLSSGNPIIKKRYEVLDYDRLNEARTKFIGKTIAFSKSNDALECLSCLTDGEELFALLTTDSNYNLCLSNESDLNELIKSAELNYDKNRLHGDGNFPRIARTIGTIISQHLVYNPYRLTNYYVNSRIDLHDGFFAFNSTKAMTSLICACLMGFNIAIDQIEQYSQDTVVGPLGVWIAFSRTRNKLILECAIPKLLEKWGIDSRIITQNIYEGFRLGHKVPPVFQSENAGDMIYDLELNSYKLIALDIMERITRIMAMPENQDINHVLTEFKSKFKETFFDNSRGLFLDRFTAGDFSMNAGVSSFICLAGGAGDEQKIVDMTIVNLKDTSKLGGYPSIPTISKDNPLYGKKTKRSDGSISNKFDDFKGSVSCLYNFITYLGLTRLGISDIASELAVNSIRLGDAYFEKYRIIPEILNPKITLDSLAKENSLTGHLMGIVGLCDLLDVEYFNDDLRPTLRFGSFTKGEHKLYGQKIFGRKFNIEVTNKGLRLFVDDENLFEGEGEKFIIRSYKENPDGAEFFIYSKGNLSLSIKPEIFAKREIDKFSFNINMGRFKVILTSTGVKIRRVS